MDGVRAKAGGYGNRARCLSSFNPTGLPWWRTPDEL